MNINEMNLSQAIDFVKKKIEDKFSQSKKIATILALGYRTQKNVLLYGPPGYGKSVISETCMRMLGETPFIIACGASLTEDKILGGINFKKYRDEGMLEYMIEYSLFNHRVVILDEIGDAAEETQLALKDALSSGFIRKGNQMFKIKTELVIALSNKTPKEMGHNDSTRAVMERFPLKMEVKWDSHNKEDYQTLFAKVTGKNVDDLDKNEIILSMALEYSFQQGKTISPRIAREYLDVTNAHGSLDLCQYVEEMDMRCLLQAIEDYAVYEEDIRIKNVLKSYTNSNAVREIVSGIDIDKNTIVINKFLESLKDIPESSELTAECTRVREQLKKALKLGQAQKANLIMSKKNGTKV